MKPYYEDPAPYYSDERATLYRADALAVLASLPTASVDAPGSSPSSPAAGSPVSCLLTIPPRSSVCSWSVR